MKIDKFLGRSRAAGFLALCMILTGCAGREAEFLKTELRETEAEADEENAEAFGREQETGAEGAENGEIRTGDARTKGAKTEGSNAAGADESPGGVLTEKPQEPAEIYVDVCGAVAEPGVFKLTEGSRVFQAIEAAGGYLPEAAEGYVNRAGFLTDGQQIYVPTEEETGERVFPGGESAGGRNGEAALTAAGADKKVNLNTADEAELTTLKGIGATRARAILSYREENGAFRAIEEIMNVQGIKEGTFDKIKDNITID